MSRQGTSRSRNLTNSRNAKPPKAAPKTSLVRPHGTQSKNEFRGECSPEGDVAFHSLEVPGIPGVKITVPMVVQHQHKYYVRNPIGEFQMSPEEAMVLIKNNLESAFPGAVSWCDKPIKLGSECKLGLPQTTSKENPHPLAYGSLGTLVMDGIRAAGFPWFMVTVVEETPTSFTFKAGPWHVFKGTAKHSVEKDGNTLFLVQEGYGPDSYMSCFNNTKAEEMWRAMADNVRKMLMEHERSRAPTLKK